MGSPLYQIGPEHSAGLVALILLAGATVLRGRPFQRLAPMQMLLAALLASSAAVHAGLAVGHDHGGPTRLLFLIDAALLALITRRVLRGASIGRLGAATLLGSIVAYWGSTAGGEPPDQLGIATKLAEILALAIAAQPAPGVRRGWLGGTASGLFVVFLVFGTSASAWIGAFRSASHTHDEVAGHHVHGGTAPPGAILPVLTPRDPTPAERAAAERLVLAARSALAKYSDPAVAAADGYQVDGMRGLDFHARNPAHEKDGKVLDPAHPETLVYAVAPDGQPVLLGAMFMMEGIHEPGPPIGGPLTMWHAHEHICLSVVPPALSGILSPLGMCPVGSIDLALTSEMIHMWIVPGVPQPFGDLSDEWKRAYVARVAAR